MTDIILPNLVMTSDRITPPAPRRLAGVLAALLSLAAAPAQGAEPAPPTADAVHAAAARLVSAPSDPAARAEVDRLVEADYPLVHRCFTESRDERERGMLRAALRLDAFASADVVLRGTVTGVEQIQGGVIDYHTLIVTFATLAVERIAPAARDDRDAKTFVFARGTSRDWWLCNLMQERLENTKGDRVWLLRRHELVRHEGNVECGFVYYEFETLPGAALDVLRAGR